MNGHIRQRSPGSFELRYRVGGAVRTETIRTTSKKAAAARLRELLVAVDRNEHVTPSRMTLATWMAERISMWQLSPRTRALPGAGQPDYAPPWRPSATEAHHARHRTMACLGWRRAVDLATRARAVGAGALGRQAAAHQR